MRALRLGRLDTSGFRDSGRQIPADQRAQRVRGGWVEPAAGGEGNDRLDEVVRRHDDKAVGIQIDHMVKRRSRRILEGLRPFNLLPHGRLQRDSLHSKPASNRCLSMI